MSQFLLFVIAVLLLVPLDKHKVFPRVVFFRSKFAQFHPTFFRSA